tara:strand:- start:112 stop:234 length:123 start_codon:yes stop_codon:yes gene_type:complete
MATIQQLLKVVALVALLEAVEALVMAMLPLVLAVRVLMER